MDTCYPSSKGYKYYVSIISNYSSFHWMFHLKYNMMLIMFSMLFKPMLNAF